MWNWLRSLAAFTRYSANQVFAGKFVYFLLLALLTFCTVVIVHTVQEEVPPNPEAIYYFLLVPGVLLTFYPSAYCVQSDVDGRMIETLFGIPNYRYKVWLARHLVQHLVVAVLLLLLAIVCEAALADFSVGAMVIHLMFPILFLSSIGFMLATLIRGSGNGVATILLIIIMVFWMTKSAAGGTRWDLYLNPFEQADSYENIALDAAVLYNRIYLLVGAVAATLLGLLRLQKREKFV
jgi:hypothetical protein